MLTRLKKEIGIEIANATIHVQCINIAGIDQLYMCVRETNTLAKVFLAGDVSSDFCDNINFWCLHTHGPTHGPTHARTQKKKVSNSVQKFNTRMQVFIQIE